MSSDNRGIVYGLLLFIAVVMWIGVEWLKRKRLQGIRDEVARSEEVLHHNLVAADAESAEARKSVMDKHNAELEELRRKEREIIESIHAGPGGLAQEWNNAFKGRNRSE